jgi:urea transport system substrate-binding protein
MTGAYRWNDTHRATDGGRAVIRVGVLYSLAGPYGAIGRAMLDGLLLAVEQTNADATLAFRLELIVCDPAGILDQYHEMCHWLLYRAGVRHVIGCYTSASRKRVLPLIEGANALLWHAPRYEGFESSANVIYLGAAPNQHVVPLMEHVANLSLPSMYCVGSHYVWSWEINRIARDAMQGMEGQVLGERLVPMSSVDVDDIVADIVEKRPASVLNTLVGESAYAFYRAWDRAARTHAFLASSDVLRMSLTLCEPEVQLVGAPMVEGYVVSSVYFQSIRSAENRRFVADYQERFGRNSPVSVDTEAAYIAGILLARSLRQCSSDEVDAVRSAAYSQIVQAPQGTVRIDAENNHAYLTPRLARCGADGQFVTFWEAPDPVQPDPYLARMDLSTLSGTLRDSERSAP